MAGKLQMYLTGHSFILVVFVSCSLCITSNVSAESASRSFDQRIKHLERLLQNQNLMEMLASLRSLQREVSVLRGDLELLNHNLGQIKRQQKVIYIDLDERVEKLNKNIINVSAKIAPQSSLPSLSEANGQDLLNEQDAYQASLAILKDGRYEEAIESFQIYLITYPSSTYASNAQYWMAEAYYVLKDYQSAVAQFNKVINAYPGSRKVPDAFLKIGFSYYELKDWNSTRIALNRIMSDYRNSTAAKLAQRRLKKMSQEGV